jgi:glucan biosynthesis protein C
LAATLGLLLVVARLNRELVSDSGMLLSAVRIGRILYAWVVIVALLALARRFFNRRGAVLSYLTEAVFPYYIIHQTAIVMVGYWLIPYRLPVAVEATLIVAATMLTCVAGFEVVRRVSLLRPLFGLPVRRRTGTAMSDSQHRVGSNAGGRLGIAQTRTSQMGSSKVTIETSPSSAP